MGVKVGTESVKNVSRPMPVKHSIGRGEEMEMPDYRRNA